MPNTGPTGREWGDLSRHVEEIRHDIRNMRTVQDGQMDLLMDLERRVSKIYTTVSVAVVFFGLIGFIINLFI